MTPSPASHPLVLLHGFTGSPESWGVVRREIRALAGAPTAPEEALAPAALGHAGPATTASAATWDDELDRLADLIRNTAVEPAHLVGYSMGGRLALGLLVRHPELFRSATLIGASPGLTDAAERAERAAQDEKWARLLDEEGLDSFVAAWEALPLFASQAGLPADALERQDRIRRSHDPAGLARSLRVLGLARMPDYRPQLPEVGIPVRLVVGERDDKFRRLAEAMAERLPRATVTVVPDAGHNLVLERPTEIAGLIREDLHA